MMNNTPPVPPRKPQVPVAKAQEPARYTFDNLIQNRNLVKTARNYYAERDGDPDWLTAPDDMVVNQFVSDRTFKQASTIGAAAELNYATGAIGEGANDTQKRRLAYLREQWDQLPSVFEEGGRGWSGVGKNLAYGLADAPLALLSGGAGAIAGKVAAGAGANALTKGLTKAGTTMATDAALGAVGNVVDQGTDVSVGRQEGINAGEAAAAGALTGVIGSAPGLASPVLKPIGELTDKVWNKVAGQHAQKVLNKIGERFTLLKDMPLQDQYRIARGKARGQIAESQEIAKELNDGYAKFGATEQDRDQIKQYLTDATASPGMIANENLRELAINTKMMFNDLGQQLVDRGIIPQESYDKYVNQYMPRMYVQFMKGESGNFGNRSRMDLGYKHERMDDTQLTPEIRKQLGEITDPQTASVAGILNESRDIAIHDFLSTIAQTPEWAIRDQLIDWQGKKVSAQWLKEFAKESEYNLKANNTPIGDPAWTLNAQMHQQADAALSQITALAKASQGKFIQLPDSPAYGPLRGLYVRKEIRDDLVGGLNFILPDKKENFGSKVVAGLERVEQSFTRRWKSAKIAANPPTVLRNIMSNASLMHVSGVDADRMMPLLIESFDDYLKGGDLYKVARDNGVTVSTFTNTEMYRMRDELVRSWEAAQGNPVTGMLDVARKALDGIDWTLDKAGDLYQGIETVFKMAKIKDGMDKGLSPEQAVLDAQKWLFDYSEVPLSLQHFRKQPLIGSPFITFMYKAAPRMAEAALTRPTKFLPYYGMMLALEEVAKDNFNMSGEDLEVVRQMITKHAKDKNDVYFFPVLDGEGRMQFIDFGYMLPWSPYVDMANYAYNAAGGEGEAAKKLVDQFGLMGMPTAQIIEAVITGKDPFSGQPIVPPGADGGDVVAGIFKYMWNLSMPTVLHTDYGALMDLGRKGVFALTEEEEQLLPWDKTAGQRMANLAGFNMYNVDPMQARQRAAKAQQGKLAELSQRRNSELKSARSGSEKETITRQHNERVGKLLDKKSLDNKVINEADRVFGKTHWARKLSDGK